MLFQKHLNRQRFSLIGIVLLIFVLIGCSGDTHDWPTYRHDAVRSATTGANLPDNLSLRWVFNAPHAPKTAWHTPGEELPRMHFDNSYQLAAGNGLTYFGSSVDDQLNALDTQSGEPKWAFYAESPIRFAPSLWKDYLYFGSDDGRVYCLNAKNGEIVWHFRAGPSDKKVLGNGRLISLWPVRTSVLVLDEVVYFGAGIFPYEGLYIYALDAETGKIIWKNDTVGDAAHELQFGGISPHGYLLASDKILYVPSGRAMPAAFDRHTGEFLYTLSPGSKVGGTWGLISDDQLIAGVERSGTPAKIAYDLETGQRQGDLFASFDGIDLVTTNEVSYVITESGIEAIDRVKYPEMRSRIDSISEKIGIQNRRLQMTAAAALESDIKNPKFDELIARIDSLKNEQAQLKAASTRWQFADSLLSTLILAGNQIVAGGEAHLVVLDAATGKLQHRLPIKGTALGLAVADDCLLATNDRGEIYGFGAGDFGEPGFFSLRFENPFLNHADAPVYREAAAQILESTGVQRGYCLVLDAGEGQLCYELARQSELKVIGIETDLDQLKRALANLRQTRFYSTRVVLGNWDLASLPEYFANLVVSDAILQTEKITAEPAAVYRLLKPFGGVLCLGQVAEVPTVEEEFLTNWLHQAGPESPVVSQENGLWVTLTRSALPGAGGWTHQYANPANTSCGDDQIVSYPFGVLWFGEPGPERMVERHARAAAPVAKNGRLFVQGENVVMAYDAYNGLKLWEREIPGANRVRVDVDGGNLALSDAGVFVATGDKCLLLDAATGTTLRTFELPPATRGQSRRWGYVACVDGTLFGSAAMPLAHDYNYISEQLEAAASDELAAFFLQYQSSEQAQQDFQRSGAKWHFIADFPAWSGGIVTQEPATDKLMFSDAVFAVDIQTGKTQWVHRGQKIAHISIAIGDGQVYLTDAAVSASQQAQGVRERRKYFENGVWKSYKEKVQPDQTDVRLITALDSETGAKKWARPVDLSGCGGDAVAAAYQQNTLLFFGSFGLHDKWRFPAGELEWHRVTALSAGNGEMLWSRPLNYMVRPVIIGDEIIVEPRACDLFTGEIKTRKHPITGQTVPWEYYRPGHTCAVTSASSNCLFYRSYNAAFYDLAADRGITYFGAIRPGCWINMIPANGLLLFPEASAGCTCSFPLRTTVVLQPQPPKDTGDWSVFISQGPITPVQRLGINLGAPGDKKDPKGNLWFGYPRPKTEYGVKFRLNEQILENMGYFDHDVRNAEIPGDTPWLFTSGCVGLTRCEIPLLDPLWDASPGFYTVRLGFWPSPGTRKFDIRLQDSTVVTDFELTRAQGENSPIVKEFNRLQVADNLRLELVPRQSNPKMSQAPVIHFIEILREDTPVAAGPAKVVLKPDELGQALQKADQELARENPEKALELYHAVFQTATDSVAKFRALNGMAEIGSPASLPVIEKYLRVSTPIFWDYQPPGLGMIDKVVAVFVAIAENLAPAEPERAQVMFGKAAELATDFALRDRIMASIQKFGFSSDAKNIVPEQTTPGIRYEYFEGYFNSVNDLDDAKPRQTGIMEKFQLANPEGVTEFGYIFQGFLTVPQDGIYTFYLESNDGSKLFLRGRELIDNDGGHGVLEKSVQLPLQAGQYPIVVKYFQMGGGQALKVSWESEAFAKQELTQTDLVCGVGE